MMSKLTCSTASFAKYGPSITSLGREQTEAEDNMALTGPAVDPQAL